jgi:hypothetical protein
MAHQLSKLLQRIEESDTVPENKEAYEHIYPSVSENYLIHIQLPRRLLASECDPLQGQKVPHLQASHTFQELSLWPALQDLVPLLPLPLRRKQSTPNRASPPAIIITVSSTKVQRNLPSIHRDIAMPRILLDLPTTTSNTWSHHFHPMPTTMDGQGHKNLS